MQLKKDKKTGISVIMPTFKHEEFIIRAIKSLMLQTFEDWELIIINDGSPDNTKEVISPFLVDQRIRYFENECNEGLGYCLNLGTKYAKNELIAYLPSDDIYFKNHLYTLHDLLIKDQEAVLAYSILKSEYYQLYDAAFPENPITKSLQLVQVLHKKVDESWVERSELVTDDLEKMFFSKLKVHGEVICSDQQTCEWVEHDLQRFKIINEGMEGGIYRYKLFYNVSAPLRFKSTYGNYIDEFRHYENFRAPNENKADRPLKILLVGELAYNPERIYALEQKGHKLYGLWCPKPLNFNTVGPLPFGNVEDVPYQNWQERVQEIQPDIIYSLLNMQTIDFAHEILIANKKIPFVWHFKEGPFFCIKYKLFKKLTDLYNLCDGQVFTNPETRDWFNQFLLNRNIPSFLLDGDLPKADWFTNDKSKLLSEIDGEVHTAITGRPMGFEIGYIQALAEQKIHLHFYGDLYQSQQKRYLKEILASGNKYFHIHPVCDHSNWVKELSQYDAGWLHLFDSQNYGELLRTNWDDLNYPARIPTLAAAGLPMIQKDNTGHIVATQSLTKKLDIGIFFKDINKLGLAFEDKNRLAELHTNVWEARKYFQFDTYVDDLLSFFHEVIDGRLKRNG